MPWEVCKISKTRLVSLRLDSMLPFFHLLSLGCSSRITLGLLILGIPQSGIRSSCRNKFCREWHVLPLNGRLSLVGFHSCVPTSKRMIPFSLPYLAVSSRILHDKFDSHLSLLTSVSKLELSVLGSISCNLLMRPQCSAQGMVVLRITRS